MKLFVTGTRGVPGVPGGVERHCEQLYPLIEAQETEVMIARRASYVEEKLDHWKGIGLVDLFSPQKKSLEAILHTTLALFEAKRQGADIVHIHAIGPALMAPLGRLLGMKVVVTNHGPDYDRQKWGGAAKKVLRLGEYLGCKYANEVIVISEPIRDIVKQRCGRESHLIYNGVPIPELKDHVDYLDTLGLKKGGYLLAVARLVPEKGLHNLIEAFGKLESKCKLVIAGDSDHEDAYSKVLKDMGASNPNIVMPGYVTGDDLSQLFTNARLFVLPSYHEGLPIALLEALSYGLPVVISDIPANLEVGLDDDCYFVAGDVEELCDKLGNALAYSVDATYSERTRDWVRKKYNWDTIAEQTMGVYDKVLSGH